MKKQIIPVVPPIIFLALAMFFSACQQGELTDELTSDSPSVSDDEIGALPTYQAALMEEPKVSHATLDTEMQMISDGFPENLDEATATIVVDSNGHRWNLLNCLDTLNLSQGQQDSIKVLTRRLHRCRKFHIQEVRLINQTIIRQANQDRKIIIRKYHNGNLSKPETIKALKRLNKRTRQALTNNAEKQRHIRHVRQCFFKYLRGLHHVLDETQWQQFVSCYRHQ